MREYVPQTLQFEVKTDIELVLQFLSADISRSSRHFALDFGLNFAGGGF